jgi:hypothetical protein
MLIKENDYITAKGFDKQMEVLCVCDGYLYCADDKGNGIKVPLNDVLTCGKRNLKELHNQFGRF